MMHLHGQSLRIPNDCKNYLGLLNYFGDHLSNVLKSKCSFGTDKEYQQFFESLESRTTACLFYNKTTVVIFCSVFFPKFQATFFIAADASNQGIGAKL